jgi:hypothetical protein
MARSDVSVRFGADIGDLQQGADLGGHVIEQLTEPVKTLGGAFEALGSTATTALEKVAGAGGDVAKKLGEAVGSAGKSSFDLGAVIGTLGGGAAIVGLVKLLNDSDHAMSELVQHADQANISVARLQQLSYAASLRGVGSDEFNSSLSKSAGLIDEMGRKENDFSKLLDANGIKWKDQHGVIVDTDSALTIVADLVQRAANYSEAVKIAEWAGYSEKMVPFLRQGAAAIEDAAKAAPLVSEALARSRAEAEQSWNAALTTITANIKTFVVEATPIIGEFLANTGKVLYGIAMAMRYVLESVAGISHDWADKSDFASRWAEGFKQATVGADTFTGAFKRAADAVFAAGRGPTTKLLPDDKDDKTDKDATRAAIEAAAERIKVIDSEYAQEATRISEAAKLYQLTEGQKTAALLAALDRRAQAEQEELGKEMAIDGLSLSQKQRIYNQALQLAEKYNSDRLKITNAALQQEMKDWQGVLGSIQGAWDSQLKGLLAGTTSWSSAMKSIFADLILEIIKQFEKAALAKAAAGLAGLGLDIGTGGLGGALFGGLTKLATGLLSFDVGGDVLTSGLAMVHAGETIVPATANQPFQGTGSGSPVAINVQAPLIGAQAAINQFIPQIARALRQYQSLNPSLT